MGRDDWYRNRTWDDVVEKDFEARFARTRQPWSRWQYLLTQASTLRASHPEVARSLLARSAALSGAEPPWVCASLTALAEVELALGEDDAAEAHLREAIAAAPRPRSMSGERSPEQLLGRLLWIRRGGGPEVDALIGPPSALGRDLPVPDAPADASGTPYRDPDDAAEAVVVRLHVLDLLTPRGVDDLFAASPAALVAIDRLLYSRPVWSLFGPWLHGRFELPAYVGRVLVRGGRAEWVPAARLVDWGLRSPHATIPALYPFAWDALGRGMPLVRLAEALCSPGALGPPG